METAQDKCFERAEKHLKEAYREMLMGLKHESECSELSATYVEKIHGILVDLNRIIKKL